MVSLEVVTIRSRCGVCGTAQIKTGTAILNLCGKEFEIAQYNIKLMTHTEGVDICEDCMDKYSKINALMTGINFSRAGVSYYADGRNLKGNSI